MITLNETIIQQERKITHQGKYYVIVSNIIGIMLKFHFSIKRNDLSNSKYIKRDNAVKIHFQKWPPIAEIVCGFFCDALYIICIPRNTLKIS